MSSSNHNSPSTLCDDHFCLVGMEASPKMAIDQFYAWNLFSQWRRLMLGHRRINRTRKTGSHSKSRHWGLRDSVRGTHGWIHSHSSLVSHLHGAERIQRRLEGHVKSSRGSVIHDGVERTCEMPSRPDALVHLHGRTLTHTYAHL